MSAHETGPSLNGLRAVVTGSSSGIGRAILLELAQAGAEVVAHANSSFPEAERLSKELVAAGKRAWALRADLRSTADCVRLVDEASVAMGGIDVWVNNAGADILTRGKPTLNFETRLQDVWAVDVRATMILTRTVGARMREAKGGVILNMGWDQAETGMEGDSAELYAAAKGAVMSFSRCAALSLAPGVRVNCIAPGWIQTAWGATASGAWHERVVRETPLGRWGRPEDVGRVARFLVSPEAAYLTGQVIRVNGGAVR